MKRQAHRDADMSDEIGGISPRQGFPLRDSVQLWFLVTGFPSLLSSVAMMAFLGGIMWDVAILWLAGALLLMDLFSLLTIFAWFHRRGWAVAIMEIEHARRQRQMYPIKDEEANLRKMPRTRRSVRK